MAVQIIECYSSAFSSARNKQQVSLRGSYFDLGFLMAVLQRKRSLSNCFAALFFIVSVILVKKVFQLSDVQVASKHLEITDTLQRQYFINNKGAAVIEKAMHIFNQRDLIVCFDELVKSKAKRKLNEKGMRYMEMESFIEHLRLDSRTLHFALVGDSRIRHLFIMFTKVIPAVDCTNK